MSNNIKKCQNVKNVKYVRKCQKKNHKKCLIVKMEDEEGDKDEEEEGKEEEKDEKEEEEQEKEEDEEEKEEEKEGKEEK